MTLAPRWRKLIGDFGATRGRIALMLAALTIGMFALTTISGAYTILSRRSRGTTLTPIRPRL